MTKNRDFLEVKMVAHGQFLIHFNFVMEIIFVKRLNGVRSDIFNECIILYRLFLKTYIHFKYNQTFA